MSAVARFASLSVLLSLAPSAALAEPESDVMGTVVKGEIFKPEITIVVMRDNLNKPFQLKLDENFLDRIVESVKHEPF